MRLLPFILRTNFRSSSKSLGLVRSNCNHYRRYGSNNTKMVTEIFLKLKFRQRKKIRFLTERQIQFVKSVFLSQAKWTFEIEKLLRPTESFWSNILNPSVLWEVEQTQVGNWYLLSINSAFSHTPNSKSRNNQNVF